MVSGVVLLVGASGRSEVDDVSPAENSPLPRAIGAPLECIQILGKTMLHRVTERFGATDPAAITVLANSSCSLPDDYVAAHETVKIKRTEDLWLAAAETLREYSENDIQHAFIVEANTYVECDLVDLLEFHRHGKRTVTATYDSDGPLAWWVVDCAKTHSDLLRFLLAPQTASSLPSYFVSSYTNRLRQPADLRRLVADAFRGACAMRPSGEEIRPGVFVEEGAQIDKRARIVAPTFVGRDTRVREDTLVTRSSNIEDGCYIDCGTAVEDSSILSNTYVGICLDVSHSIVQENVILHVGRNVEVEISDESVVRENVAVRDAAAQLPLTLSRRLFGSGSSEMSAKEGSV